MYSTVNRTQFYFALQLAGSINPSRLQGLAVTTPGSIELQQQRQQQQGSPVMNQGSVLVQMQGAVAGSCVLESLGQVDEQ